MPDDFNWSTFAFGLYLGVLIGMWLFHQAAKKDREKIQSKLEKIIEDL